jgi:hypothetical protein
MNNNSGESLFLYINGNITNNGEWINYLTHVYVRNEQYIELIDDKPIEGIVKFDAVVQSDTYQWYYDDSILESEDFDGETSQVLTWLVPVSSEWYGSFYCETGNRETVGILLKKGYTGIEEKHQIDASIWSFDQNIYTDLQESTQGEVFVYDLKGRKIKSYIITRGLTKQHIETCGFYVIWLKVGSKMISRKIYIM